MIADSTKRLIYIGGPTASGKTSIAIKVAGWLGTEILSCDSRQFYKELKVGAAPPSKSELSLIPHHFIQDRSVTQPLTAGQFEEEGIAKLNQLYTRFNDVVMVGGSGLFANALLYGFDDLPDAEPAYRKELEVLLKQKGLKPLQDMLQEKDPDYFNQVDIHNPHRIIRALEIIHVSGNTYSALRTKENNNRPFESLVLILDLPRQELYERINHRVDKMVEIGLEAEAKSLANLAHLQSLNTVGYKEWFAHFNGEISREEAIEKIKQNTRRFAKRQLTWFRRYKNAHWVHPENAAEIKRIIANSLDK